MESILQLAKLQQSGAAELAAARASGAAGEGLSRAEYDVSGCLLLGYCFCMIGIASSYRVQYLIMIIE